MKHDVLIFQVEDLLLAVPIGPIREVIRAAALSAVPDPLSDFEGVLNDHGSSLLVYDLRKRLALPRKPVSSHDRLILLDVSGSQLALRADCTLEIVSVAETLPFQGNEDRHSGDIFAGTVPYGERLAFLLNLDQIASNAKQRAGSVDA